MIYMGSKRRIAKRLLPIILNDRENGQFYVEPFVGGGNMIDNVRGPRIGADINEYAIAALKCIRDTPYVLPATQKEADEDVYATIKANKASFPKGIVGYFGFNLSYSGRWFSGPRRDAKGEDYVAQSHRGAMKQSVGLQGADLRTGSYDSLDIPPRSIIYCDPPYQGTAGYDVEFEHDLFWQWCRDRAAEGHSVFISEYSAPEDFECIWSKKVQIKLSSVNSGTAAEKLFVYRPGTVKEALKAKAKLAECYETPLWAAEGILHLEDVGPRVVDPCCGPGVLTRAAQAKGHTVTATDLYDWGFGLPGVDFLDTAYTAVYQSGGEFTVFMNPPFSKACEFVERAFALGARKVVCSQRFAWYESVRRREFWDDMPCSRIWLCGNRATCWRRDISEEERRKSGGSPTAHAWFIFEPGHVGDPVVKRFYKE